MYIYLYKCIVIISNLTLFAVINLISFTVIAASYAIMYCVARRTQQEARDPRRGNMSTRTPAVADTATMGRRMTLIVATDAACWLPIIALSIASLCGVEIPDEVSKLTEVIGLWQYIFCI